MLFNFVGSAEMQSMPCGSLYKLICRVNVSFTPRYCITHQDMSVDLPESSASMARVLVEASWAELLCNIQWGTSVLK